MRLALLSYSHHGRGMARAARELGRDYAPGNAGILPACRQGWRRSQIPVLRKSCSIIADLVPPLLTVRRGAGG